MIKIGRKRKVKYFGKKCEILEELAHIICELRKNFSEDEIKIALKVGNRAYEKFIKKPKIENYEINADNKEDAIKQIKRLELPKEVEKIAISHITKII